MKRGLTYSLLILWLIFCREARSQEIDTQELFSKAYSLFSKGDLPQAEELFRKTLDDKFLLKDYSLYFLGVIAFSQGNLASGRNYFSQLGQKFPQSVWSGHADLQLAKLSLAEKNYQQALAELRALRNRRLGKEILAEAHYLLGQLHETLGELKAAYSVYRELRRASPLSPWAALARKEARRLREEQPQLFGPTRADALLDEAELLDRERQYQEAEKAYRTLADLAPRGPLRPRFLLGLANSLRAARKREEAIPVLTEIIENHPRSAQAPNALYRLAEIYWNRDENVKALDYFKQLGERYPKGPFNDIAHYAAARIHESLGKPAEALRLYREFAGKFPDSPMHDEAGWRLAWVHYLQADYDRAYAAFRRLATDKREGRYKIAALYWQGRTAQMTGRAEEATQIYLRILNGREESYYKGPAAGRLSALGVAIEEKKSADSNPGFEPTLSLSSDRSFHFTRAQELAQISLGHLAVAELDEIKNLHNEDLSLRLTLMREYARNRAYARSVALATQIYLPSDELDRHRYPLAYWETIQQTAEKKGLDPYLVLALIRQESLFDPKALSSASAYGLMQLLPSTAVRAAAQLGLPPPQPQKLYEPELNLMLGTHYLKELLQRYSNNPVKAIAAYNAGENAVARWEKQIAVEDEEEFIERITYTETRNYVKLVLRNYRIYKNIYDTRK